VSSAHEWVVSKYDVTDFSPEHCFGTRKVMSIASNAFDCLSGEAGITWSGRGTKDPCSVARLGREVPFRFFHDFKP
jgi:hypothetical protein